MVVYVVFGGMLATTWVQIVKAGMLMIGGIVIARRGAREVQLPPARSC